MKWLRKTICWRKRRLALPHKLSNIYVPIIFTTRKAMLNVEQQIFTDKVGWSASSISEADLPESCCNSWQYEIIIVPLFKLKGWHTTNRTMQTRFIESIHPLKGCKLNIVNVIPVFLQIINYLRLIKPIDRFSQSIVVLVTSGAHRDDETRVIYPICVANK